MLDKSPCIISVLGSIGTSTSSQDVDSKWVADLVMFFFWVYLRKVPIHQKECPHAFCDWLCFRLHPVCISVFLHFLSQSKQSTLHLLGRGCIAVLVAFWVIILTFSLIMQCRWVVCHVWVMSSPVLETPQLLWCHEARQIGTRLNNLNIRPYCAGKHCSCIYSWDRYHWLFSFFLVSVCHSRPSWPSWVW